MITYTHTKPFDGTIEFTNSKNYTIKMDMIAFGKGAKTLVLIPGLSDGLTSVKGNLLGLWYNYRIFVKDFRILVISRPDAYTENYSIRDMADDYYDLLTHLGITSFSIWGVSMGGMITQSILVKYPHAVKAACLDVTSAKTSDAAKNVIDNWISLAQQNKVSELMQNTLLLTYTDKKLKTYRFLLPLIIALTRPSSLERFIVQAHACKNHDEADKLPVIATPCLVTGGDSDKILGKGAVESLADLISSCTTHIYKGYGHSSFDENKGHNKLVLTFFKNTL